MSEEQTGDWYCQNCGYLSASRVTYHETCDECHIPVAWHTVDEMSAIERAIAEEREACALVAAGFAKQGDWDKDTATCIEHSIRGRCER